MKNDLAFTRGRRRRRPSAATAVAAALAAFLAGIPAPPTRAEVVAPSWGVYQGAGCDGVRRLEQFEQWSGIRPDHGLEFLSWDALERTSRWSMRCWSDAGMRTMTYSLPMLPADGSATLADGAAGRFDELFARFGAALVEEGFPDAIIRIGWEFNGDWYPWAAAKDPESWKAYWRRIVTVMREVPGARFRFDWNPAGGWHAFDPEQAWPGADYVDIIGLDFYNSANNPHSTPEQRWQARMNAPTGLTWHREFARRHDKPMSFPEWGTGQRPDGTGGGDDPYFIEQMAAWIAAHDVVYHHYWDYSAGDYDARLSDDSQPAAGAAFLRAFGATAR